MISLTCGKILTKRPHTLKYKTPASNPTQDDDGNWIPGYGGAEITVPCRYEPNGAAKVIAGPDGTSVLYNGICYLERGATSISFDTTVHVFEGDNLLASGNVIRFSAGQMNARLWV